MRYRELQTDAIFYLRENDRQFNHLANQKAIAEKLYTIAWNSGDAQQVFVDGIGVEFPGASVIPLMINQRFAFERPEDIIAFQFNREFYCIIDHDRDVSCAGFLFYGVVDVQVLQLSELESRSFHNLLQVFREEFANDDHVQGEMLRMLLKRLIIKVTRLARQLILPAHTGDVEYDIVRQYKMEVERYYKQQHAVAYYAGLMHKSPKTLSNVFHKLHDKTPLAVIHERLVLEARRLMLYTDKSAKEIAFELGFDEAGNFSRFFKKMTGMTPTQFKQDRLLPAAS